MKFSDYVKLIQDIIILTKKGWTYVKSDDRVIMYEIEGIEYHFSDLESLESFVQEEVKKYV